MKFIINSTRCFFILLLFVAFTNAQAKVYNVLFIGNSYIAVNDLPNMLKQLSLSLGDSINVTSNTPGGSTFAAHTLNATTISLLQQTNWDFIILQAQSQEPSFSPAQVQNATYPYAKTLDSLAKHNNKCAQVFYYMTWGRKYGDANNCANYPVICTYLGMQGRLRESYLEMAKDNNSNTAPVGIVWQNVRSLDSTIELYNPDLSHPSISGTYLAACTFYNSLFKKQIKATAYVPAGVTNALLIQTTSNSIVLDSMDIWQQYGSMPNANFNSNNKDSFYNSSTNYTMCNWQFGDGNTINNNNAVVYHNYTSSGIYTVSITVIDSCGKKDSIAKVINVNQVNSINKNEINSTIVCNNHILSINASNNTIDKLELFSLSGIKVFTVSNLNSNNNSIAIPLSLNGLYLVQIQFKNKVEFSKIWIH
jgi:PKD repeat protein